MISVADAIVLATFTDGVVMVVQPDKVSQAVVRRATSEILAVKAWILGVVMNGALRGAATFPRRAR